MDIVLFVCVVFGESVTRDVAISFVNEDEHGIRKEVGIRLYRSYIGASALGAQEPSRG